jgi:hypothetical protein
VNRKSIVQIFVLVLLVAVGAGVYLSQQDGGLDFIKDLVGLGPSAQPKTPPPRPVRKAAAAAPRPAPQKPARKAPAIPEQPASGQIHNAAFAVNSAEIENGVLTLRQGADPLGSEVKLFLQTKPWHVPEGRNFEVSNATAPGPNTPMVRVLWRKSGQREPSQQDFTGRYTLTLKLGKVRGNELHGKIYLVLSDENKSQIAGTFNAAVRGFRFVDGKPDLSVDSVDTLQFLALREILKERPDMPLPEVGFRQGRYTATPVVGLPTGYIEIQYRAGDGPVASRKIQFVKEHNEWRVDRTLLPDQLDAAHPREVPGPNSAPEQLFPYLAAKRIEEKAEKAHPGSLLAATEFATRYNEKQKIGVVEVGFKIGDSAPVETAFLFRQGKYGWTLARELKQKERVNLATGKVEAKL